MTLDDCILKLEEYRKLGWRWSLGYSELGYECRLWKPKDEKVQQWSLTPTRRVRGIHVVIEGGNSLLQAAGKALSRLASGSFDRDTTLGPIVSDAQGEVKESLPDAPRTTTD